MGKNIIEIFPTKIVINNYKEEVDKLQKSLSVWDKIYHTYKFKAYILDEENHTLTIPGGYNFNYIQAIFNNYEIINHKKELNSLKYPNRKLKMLFSPRNELQEEAIKFLKGNSFSLNSTQKLLSLNTGEGKTYCVLNYIVSSRRKPMVFLDQIHLKDQWIDSILKFTDIKEEEIYVIQGRESIERLMQMTEEDLNKIQFYIAIYRTIGIFLEEHSDTINEFVKEKLKVSTKVYDEAHIEYMNIFLLDSYIDCESIYVTATPERSNPIENKVFKNMIYNVRRFTSNSIKRNNSDNGKYHNIILMKMNSKPDILEQTKCQTDYGFSSTYYSNYIIEKTYDSFLDKIKFILFHIIMKEGKNKKKVAILLSLNKLVDKIYDDIISIIKENNYEYTVGKFNGKTKDRKTELSKDIIITTDKSFEKAIDVEGLTCLINTVPFSSATKNKQIIGRLRRIEGKEVYFFDLVDIGFTNCKNQIQYKKRVYKEVGKKIQEVELN